MIIHDIRNENTKSEQIAEYNMANRESIEIIAEEYNRVAETILKDIVEISYGEDGDGYGHIITYILFRDGYRATFHNLLAAYGYLLGRREGILVMSGHQISNR